MHLYNDDLRLSKISTIDKLLHLNCSLKMKYIKFYGVRLRNQMLCFKFTLHMHASSQ